MRRMFCLGGLLVFSLWAQDLYLPGMLSRDIVLGEVLPAQDWSPAVLAGGFTTLRGEWAANSTQVRIAYDSVALYLQINGRVAPGQVLRDKCSANDNMGVFADDSVEILLAPARVFAEGKLLPNEQGEYFHLCINLRGFYYSACRKDLSWQPEAIQLQSRVRQDHWLQEVKISYSDLRTICPSPGEVWRVNIARNDQGPTPATSSWSGSDSFHDLTKMGQLHFGVKEPLPQAVIMHLQTLPAYFRGTFHLPAGIPTDALVQVLLNRDTLLSSKAIDPLMPEVVTFREVIQREFLPLKEYGTIGCKVFSPSTKQIYLEKHARCQGNFQNAVTLDKYYYVPQDKNIHFSFQPETLFGHQQPEAARVDILRECQPTATILRHWQGRESSGSLALADLPFGNLYLQVQWTVAGKEFRTVRALQYHPQPLQPAQLPEKARLTPVGRTLLLDKQPIFLLAASATGKTFLQNNNCFNFNYAQYGLQENHIHTIPLEGGRFLRDRGQNWVGYTYPAWAELLPIWGKQFAQWDHTRAAFCRIAYESQMKVGIRGSDNSLRDESPAEWYQKVYREIKKISPRTLFSLHSDSPPFIPTAVENCDIFETAFWSSSYAVDMLVNLDEDLQQTAAWCPQKPTLFWLGGTIPNNRCRTAEELRTGLLMLIGRGMAGSVIHLGHGYLPAERSRLWSLLSNINAELQAVFALYQQAGEEVTAGEFVQTLPEVATYARRNDRMVLLIACNRSGFEQSLTFPAGTVVSLPGEAERKLALAQEVLSPFESKLYRLTLP